MSATRPARPRALGDGPRGLDFVERLTLFVVARHRGDAANLLHGLAEPAQRRARAFAEVVQAWDSARRQARLSHEFGARPETSERLKALVSGAPPRLRDALVARLPEALQLQYPAAETESSPAALGALAARLIREAAR